jgi:hypothetical protein
MSASKPTAQGIDLRPKEEKVVRQFVEKGKAIDKPVRQFLDLGTKVKAILASKPRGVPVIFEGRSYLTFDDFVEANFPICGRTMRRWFAKEGKTDQRFSNKRQPKQSETAPSPEIASTSKPPCNLLVRGGSLPERKLILSLCDHTGNWSSAYAADPDRYEVIKVDLSDGKDVRLFRHIGRPVHGILAAPPCTHLSIAGNSVWEEKGDAAILEAMQVVDACMRMARIYDTAWWALENPVGRLGEWLGSWAWTFDPCDYGGYLAPGEKTLVPDKETAALVDCPLFPAQDAYTKRTCIWGTARKPVPKSVAVTLPSCPDGGWRNPCFHDHKDHRSATPLGFARAFKEANP